MRSSLLPIVALLALPLPAQQLFADPRDVTLRPGESTCVTVVTTPATPGVVVVAQFDPLFAAVTPSAPTPTGPTGRATFKLTSVRPNLAGTTVAFVDAGGVFSSTRTQLTGAFDALLLGGTAGSFPGPLALELTAANPLNPGDIGLILLSTAPGTIPLGILAPGDPRVLRLSPAGLLALPGFGGFFEPLAFTRFRAPVVPVPMLPGRAVLYAQGMTFSSGRPQRLSQPQPIQLAPANSFNSRGKRISLPRAFATVLETADQRPMVAGGGQGGIFSQFASAQVDVYDPTTDAWAASTAVLTVARSLHTATRLPNGKWLLVGGVDVNNDPLQSAEIYDPPTDSFRPVGNLAEARVGHTATLLSSGQVLIAGGLAVMSPDVATTISSALASTEVFTLDATGCNGTFALGPSMRQPRAGQTALSLADGRVMMLGGVGPLFGFLPMIWQSTELGNGTAFAFGPNMATPRAIFSTVQIGSAPDRYLVAGGLSDLLGLGAPTNRAEIYTAQPGGSGSFSASGAMEMSTPRGIQAAYRFGDRVIQIGGLRGDLVDPIAIQTTDVYTISTRTWTVGPPLSASRGAYASYQDPYGVVHLIGGASGPGLNPPVSDTTDWYFR